MIRLQIVHLLPPHHGPNVLAEEFDHVQLHIVDTAGIYSSSNIDAGGIEPGPIPRKPL